MKGTSARRGSDPRTRCGMMRRTWPGASAGASRADEDGARQKRVESGGSGGTYCSNDLSSINRASHQRASHLECFWGFKEPSKHFLRFVAMSRRRSGVPKRTAHSRSSNGPRKGLVLANQLPIMLGLNLRLVTELVELPSASARRLARHRQIRT